MAEHTLRIRVSNEGRAIELEGESDQVRQLLNEYAEWIRAQESAAPNTPALLPGSTMPNRPALSSARTSAGDGSGVPFGEYLHAFSAEMTDVDRALVAATYAQEQNDDNSFSTREINQLLQEQGFRVSNPSQCIRRNVSMRRMFAVARGRFRVSRDGQMHLTSLTASDEP